MRMGTLESNFKKIFIVLTLPTGKPKGRMRLAPLESAISLNKYQKVNLAFQLDWYAIECLVFARCFLLTTV